MNAVNHSVLPTSSTAQPVRLAIAAFPVLVSYVRPDTWSITERIGQSLVRHGQLRHVGGRWDVSTAAGLESSAPSWATAVEQLFRRR